LCFGLALVQLCFGPLGWAQTFTDNFDDGNDEGWSKHDQTGGTAVYTVSNGTYRITCVSASPSGAFAYRTEEYDNFYGAIGP
jgi:hypothetical protein